MKIQKGTILLLPLLLSPSLMAGCGADSDPGNGDGDGTATGGMMGDGGTGTGGAASGGAASGGSASGGAASGGAGSGGLGSGGVGTGGNDAGTGGNDAGTGGNDAGTGGGDAGTGGSVATGSEGCGMDPGQGFASWEAGNTDGRQYDTWLPDNYDSSRPYPVILLLHGCSGFDNNVPMQQHTGSDAIVVRARGSDPGACWNVDADLPHTDAVIEDVQNRFCVDAENLFVVGWSSGAWLASRMSCDRADTYRGVATVAGGWPGGNSDCNGQLGRIFIHDENDNDNQLAWDTPGRDIMIDNNNCESSSTPVDPSPCVSYNNCDPGYPVVWCQTSGAGHSAQSQLSGPAFWDFFQSLME